MDSDFKNLFFVKFFLNFSEDFKMNSSQLKIGDRTFSSRLIVGTGKYASFEETRDAIAASGAEMITLAVRRIELDKANVSILNFLDPKTFCFYPILLVAIRSRRQS